MKKGMIVFLVILLVCLGIVLYERDASVDKIPVIITNETGMTFPEQYTQSLPPWAEKTSDSQGTVQHISVRGTVLTAPDWTQTGEYDRYYDSGNNTWFAKVKGYEHVYRFADLGITLGIKDPYTDFFYQKSLPAIYKRYKNIVYQADNPWVYIQRFPEGTPHKKDLDNPYPVSFKVPYSGADHYFKISAPDGCAPSCGIYTQLDLR